MRSTVSLLLFLLVASTGVDAQERVLTQELLQEVVPTATQFGPKEGSPPVYRAYVVDQGTGEEVLVGFAFLTSDYPPRETGYDGPIESVVGLDLEGTVTGVRVLNYNESHRRTLGDFLRVPGFQEQFTGKRVTDPFRVRRDVQNLSTATISVQAMTRAVRNAARQVAAAHLATGSGSIGAADMDSVEWVDLVERGVAQRLLGTERGVVRIELFLIRLRDQGMGRSLMGEAFDEALAGLDDPSSIESLWMIGIDGSMQALFRPGDLAVVAGQDTVRFSGANVALTGEPRTERLDGHLRNLGLLALDPAVDPDQPFTWWLDIGGLGPWTAEHTGRSELTEAGEPGQPDGGVGTDVPDLPSSEPTELPVPDGEPSAEPSQEEAASVETRRASSIEEPEPASESPGQEDVLLGELDFSALAFQGDEDESLLRRTLEGTSWSQFGVMLAAILLATGAFFRKSPALRWTALTVTLLALGWGGGGFLSVSHITSGLKVGPSVYAQNLTLLLLVSFTVITTLLWGRVFCGFLCPFGALQDFLDRAVPKRLRRNLPRPTQDKGRYVKYGVLAVVVLPALVTENISVYQFFEPFGTVFFLSPSKLLWVIAVSILLASLAIPRFYCRYLCPLGAALALGSLLSPFRIRRVQQCGVCTVCEHGCPTGAIRKERIDFHECVRCNVCEVKLITRAGACRHDMTKISKLVELRVGSKQEVGDVG